MTSTRHTIQKTAAPKKNLPLWNIDLLQVKKTTINLLVCTGKREADTNLMRITHIHSEESSSKKYRMRQEQKRSSAVNYEEHKRRTSSAQVYVNRYIEQTNQKTE